MAENVVGYAITAKLDQFRAELAKIPDIGASEAKSLTSALAKEIKQAEKAAKDAAKASKDQAKGLKDVGRASKEAADETRRAAEAMKGFKEASGDTATNAGKLAGILDLIVPGAGQAAQAVADLGDAGEVAGAAASALGVTLEGLIAVAAPVALLVAGIALAWHDYSASAKEAADFQDRLNAALDPVDDLAKATHEQITELKHNLGQLSDVEFEQTKIHEAWADKLDKGTAKLREERDALTDQMAAIGTANTEYLKLQDRLHEVNGLLDTATTLSEQGELAAQTNAEFTRDRAASEKVLADRLREKSTAEQAATEAERQRAQVHALTLHQLLAEADAETKQTAALDAATEALDRAHDAATAGIATEEERIHLAAQAARETAVAAANEAQAAADSSDERKRIARELAETLAAINQKEVADTKKSEDAKAQAAATAAAKIRSAYASSAASLASSVSSVADSVEQAAERQGESAKKTALTAFRVSQGAAIASTIVTTAEAAMRAYSDALALGPAGLALAPFAAGAAAAVGAAQVAAIATQAPPSFHAGLAPDETPAVLTRGEGVLTPRGVRALGGSDSVRNLNRGESPSSQQVVVVQQFRHRVFDAAVAENLRLPTSPLRRAIRAGRRVGHRRRDNS